MLFINCYNFKGRIFKISEIGSFTDFRDGKTYKTIRIGSQVWMAENLNYHAGSQCWCYDNLDTNCSKYGRLYLWDIACKVCPAGWHFLGDEEWKSLEKELGMSAGEVDSSGYRGQQANIGGKLKSVVGWKKPNGGACNDVGFNALPAGNYGSVEKEFYFINTNAMFWTSTSYKNEFAWYRD